MSSEVVVTLIYGQEELKLIFVIVIYVHDDKSFGTQNYKRIV